MEVGRSVFRLKYTRICLLKLLVHGADGLRVGRLEELPALGLLHLNCLLDAEGRTEQTRPAGKGREAKGKD